VPDPSLTEQFLAANRAYADGFTSGLLPVRPGRRLAILTCMDSRYTAQGILGVDLGDAHVIRNAGGRVTEDVLRSLILSAALLDTRHCVVIHHTDCGLFEKTNDGLRARIAEVAGSAPALDFLPFDDVAQSVREDVATLRASEHFPPDYDVIGFVYDVRTGRLEQIEG
jgi:carbonic anhydrase